LGFQKCKSNAKQNARVSLALYAGGGKPD